MKRREFIEDITCGSLSLICTTAYLSGNAWGAASTPDYEISRVVPTRLFDGTQCWCHPRAGIVPAPGGGETPRAVMTMNTLNLEGSDVFKGMYSLWTDNLGQNWSEPALSESLAPRYETIDGIRRPVAISDCQPCWHQQSKKLLATGHTVVYTPEWRVTHPRPRHTAYSIYDPQTDQWSLWRKMEMADPVEFGDCGAGCVQRYDLPDGTILLPVYFRPPGKNSHVTVTRCSFDGDMLRYKEHGNVLSREDETRGLHEPSMTRFDDVFYLTLRNDKQGFVTKSKDGLHFEPIRTWTFDDGTELGNYNTQQHWVTHSDGLFLVYTRRGAENDHVFRNRAPLFMAQVDTNRLCVIRKTERIVVPERGARLGNFGVADISENETWVTVAEWMQPKGCERYGSDGSVFVAKIQWKNPNRSARLL